MSYHGKLQTLKNGKADAEIQHWAYLELIKEPVKELTDEEINDIAQECWVYPKGEQAIFNQHKFARAILRKAQEK